MTGRRRTRAERLAVLRELTDKPWVDEKGRPRLNLRMTNGVYDTGFIEVPAWLAREIADALERRDH